MAGAKFVVVYPRPKDIEAFEKIFKNEHVPMAVKNLVGKTKIVASRVQGSPQGTPPFHRIVEVHFPSLKALQDCAATEGARRTMAHAESYSTGGKPIFLVAEEEVFTF